MTPRQIQILRRKTIDALIHGRPEWIALFRKLAEGSKPRAPGKPKDNSR